MIWEEGRIVWRRGLLFERLGSEAMRFAWDCKNVVDWNSEVVGVQAP